MVMTTYHWRKLPELIGISRVQAEVRPTFTLKNCKHVKKQMKKSPRLFNFSDEIEIGRWSKKHENWLIFVSPAKQKRDICTAFPALSLSSAAAAA